MGTVEEARGKEHPSRYYSGLLRQSGPRMDGESQVFYGPQQGSRLSDPDPPFHLQNSVPPGSLAQMQGKPNNWLFNRKGAPEEHCCGKIWHLVSPRPRTPHSAQLGSPRESWNPMWHPGAGHPPVGQQCLQISQPAMVRVGMAVGTTISLPLHTPPPRLQVIPQVQKAGN